MKEIFIHAQKDRNEKTLHNHTNRTDNNYAVSVEHNSSEDVEFNKEVHVGGNITFVAGTKTTAGPVPRNMKERWEGIGPYGYLLGERGRSKPNNGNFLGQLPRSRRLAYNSTITETSGLKVAR